eukprot:5507722-Prymnesium_polylepis.1
MADAACSARDNTRLPNHLQCSYPQATHERPTSDPRVPPCTTRHPARMKPSVAHYALHKPGNVGMTPHSGSLHKTSTSRSCATCCR